MPSSRRRALTAVLIACGLASLPVQAHAATARSVRLGARAVRAPHERADTKSAGLTNPTSNIEPSQTFLNACYGMGTTKAANDTCDAAAVSDFASAWSSEGLGTFALPADFDTLSVPAQLLAISDVERVGRGLTPVIGLSSSLNSYAQTGADTDNDPTFPDPFYGSAGGSNWAGAGNSALLDDFFWMYDDGVGSGNLDCQSAGDEGCWGHRDNIIGSFGSPILMGAAVAYGTNYGTSMATEYIGGDHTDSADVPPTWATISSSSPTPPAATPVGLAPSTVTVSTDTGANGTAVVTVTAPAAGADVTDSISAGSDAWSVTPSSCTLAASASCDLHLTFAPASTGSHHGVLTVTDSTGPQTVSLTGSQAAPVVVISASKTAVSAGGAVTLTATATTGLAHSADAGQRVALQARSGSTAWSTVKTKSTSVDGVARFKEQPAATVKYRLLARSSSNINEAKSAAVKVMVT